jgi:hypothetical protein
MRYLTKQSFAAAIGFAALFLLAATAVAQPRAHQTLDTEGAYTLTGTVSAVDVGRGPDGSIMTVESESHGTVEISLAPFWYLEEIGLVIEPGTAVEVVVYPRTSEARPPAAARVQPEGGEVVELRDEAGFPLWTGRGRRGWRGGAGSGPDDTAAPGRGRGRAWGRGGGRGRGAGWQRGGHEGPGGPLAAACRATLEAHLAGLPVAELTEEQVATLRHMRDEEKLARDVYRTLAETWGAPSFEHIAAAEQQHLDYMTMLAERYGLTDLMAPAADDSGGVFADEAFTALYQQLTERGATSLEEAMAVGALIEELDIADLYAALEDAPPDIAAVYQNMAKGSRNHLRTFHGHLVDLGQTYTPEHLDAAVYQEIVDSESERRVVYDENGEVLAQLGEAPDRQRRQRRGRGQGRGRGWRGGQGE